MFMNRLVRSIHILINFFSWPQINLHFLQLRMLRSYLSMRSKKYRQEILVHAKFQGLPWEALYGEESLQIVLFKPNYR